MGQKGRGQGRPAGVEDSARTIVGGAAPLLPTTATMTSVSSPEPRPSSRLVELLSSIVIGIRLGVCELCRRSKVEFCEEVRRKKKETSRKKEDRRRSDRRNANGLSLSLSACLSRLPHSLSPFLSHPPPHTHTHTINNNQLPLLKTRWKTIVALAAWQYFHGALSQLAHRLHTRPQPEPLRDAGFALLPELGPGAREWASELVFSTLFAGFVAWSFSPFFRGSSSGSGSGSGNGSVKLAEQQQQQRLPSSSSPPPSTPSSSTSASTSTPVLPAFLGSRLPTLSPPRFYTCVLYGRVLATLCACQLLRALSFLSTSLPGPNYHCRAGSPAATLPMPRNWYGHFVVDVGEQATKGCGDLIFSSHTTFALVGCLAYTAFGNLKAVKKLLWALSLLLSLLIVASRKHYTVDVVIAWYVVPLVWSFASGRWTTPERGGNGGSGRGGGGVLSGGGGGGGAKQQGKSRSKGRHLLPSSVITVSSGFVLGIDGDVENGGSSCRAACPSCGGTTATTAAAAAASAPSPPAG